MKAVEQQRHRLQRQGASSTTDSSRSSCASKGNLGNRCDWFCGCGRKASVFTSRTPKNNGRKFLRCPFFQEKPAFIFCVEDRALFCQDCDEPIHSANKLAAGHQRFLATGIRVALGSRCSGSNNDFIHNFVNPNPCSITMPSSKPSSPWGVDDLLRFSDFESSTDKESMQKENLEFGELEWLLGDDHVAAPAEVPQLNINHAANSSYRPTKSSMPPYKKARIDLQEQEEEYFTVPDLG